MQGTKPKNASQNHIFLKIRHSNPPLSIEAVLYPFSTIHYPSLQNPLNIIRFFNHRVKFLEIALNQMRSHRTQNVNMFI